MFNFIISVLVATVLSIFSTVVMSYISMATPIGPWIGPTVVLCAMILFRAISVKLYSVKNLALVTVAATVGGILATAIGFSFPTLYFLDRAAFDTLFNQPTHFIFLLSLFSLCAGIFAIVIANALEPKLIDEQNLPFPIGKLIYKMMSAQNSALKAYELMIGFISAFVFGLLRTGIKSPGIIPTQITIMTARSLFFFTIPTVVLDLSIWPMLLAIGFVTGHVIAIPMLVGALSKFIVLEPLHSAFFHRVSGTEFVLAFCSGMVLSGTLFSFIKLPYTLYRGIEKWLSKKKSKHILEYALSWIAFQVVASMGLLILFFRYFQMPWLAILFVMGATLLCTYEIGYIAGEIGLAPLGRFATFVMVPAMILFKLTSLQLILIATFVEIVGGVASDILFGRVIGNLAQLDKKIVTFFQLFGLCVSALSIGGIFWLFIHSLGLGSDSLFAYKAQSRQLLIQAHAFNYYVLLIGFLFGQALSFVRINATLVLGGLLMPLNISLGLIIGGLSALWIKNKEELYPFWSGVFAANSLWMLLRSLV